MKTKNKLLICFTTVAILATGSFACSNKHMKHSKAKEMCQMKKHKVKRGGNPIIKLVMKLDLTKEQRDKIRAILKEFKSFIKHPTHAFTKSSFDKKMFIKILNEKKLNRAEREANLIESIYTVLNDIQKKYLKTMLDMDEVKKIGFKRGCHVK